MSRKWRKGSVFGDGPRVPLDREQKAQFKAKLSLQRRPGRVTLGAQNVALALLEMMGKDGRLDPSREFLAKRADVKDVGRAIERLRLCGFLDWTRRIARAGWRCEQITNAYVLLVPACEVHFVRPVPLVRFKKEQESGFGGMTDAEAVENRDRQLRLLEDLGHRVPLT